MSNDIKTGGPAFPINLPGWGDNGAGGMTLRDYFASKALAGMLADPNVKLDGEKTKAIALIAYELADAMLAAREQS